VQLIYPEVKECGDAFASDLIMADFAYNSSSGDEPEESLSQPLDDGVPSSVDSSHLHVEETLNVMESGSPLNIQKDGSTSTAVEGDAKLPETMAARAYQLEMLDRSLKQNVIVSVCEPSRISGVPGHILNPDLNADGDRQRKDPSVRQA
jgi:hypothetical protein